MIPRTTASDRITEQCLPFQSTICATGFHDVRARIEEIHSGRSVTRSTKASNVRLCQKRKKTDAGPWCNRRPYTS